ncbi:MAG: CHAT domain-containing protein, partial [Pseudomonadota bacterium]
NDIAGEKLLSYLVENAPSTNRAESFISDTFETFLDETASRLRAIFTKHLSDFPDLVVFTHGYDWPIPRSGGQWLMSALRKRAVPQQVHSEIMRIMIDGYYGMLGNVAQDFDGRVVVVNCRGSVTEADGWYDELHPTNAGYARAADAFRRAISDRFARHITQRRNASSQVFELRWRDTEADDGAFLGSSQHSVWSMVSIGRSPENDIVLADPSISRDHARIEFGETHGFVNDLGTTNGTWIAEKRVSRSEWAVGQKLRIGKTSFELSMADRDVGAASTVSAVGDLPTISVQVCQGDIRAVESEAYVVALFLNVSPVAANGAPLAIDAAVGGAISTVVQGQRFKAELGNVTMLPVPAGSAITGQIALAGLGEIKQFGPHALEQMGWELGRAIAQAGLSDVATVPIGCNSSLETQVSTRRLLQGIASGYAETGSPDRAPMLTVKICELDVSKARDAVTAATGLQQALAQRAQSPQLLVQELQYLTGEQVDTVAVSRPLDPLYIFVDKVSDDTFAFSLLGHQPGAALPRYEKHIPLGAMDGVSSAFSAQQIVTPQIGELVASTFMPDAVRDIVAAATKSTDAPIVFVHDDEPSTVPWEAIHIDGACPVLSGGISRIYKTVNRRNLSTLRRGVGQTLRMLLIGDPQGNLPAAELEAEELASLFAKRFGAVTILSGKDANYDRVCRAISDDDFDILHFAGHALFEDDAPAAGGIELFDARLNADDLASMDSVPQLVFLNACESARIRQQGDVSVEDTKHQRRLALSRFSIAEGFLTMGVTNFIGTYWNVGDDAARHFAITLYNQLLAGEPIAVALQKARLVIAEFSPDDWMNYMHFGEPTYTLRSSNS